MTPRPHPARRGRTAGLLAGLLAGLVGVVGILAPAPALAAVTAVTAVTAGQRSPIEDVSVAVPYPGHSASFSVRVVNTEAVPATLHLQVLDGPDELTADDDLLVGGDTPLHVTLVGPSGRAVADGPLGELVGAETGLGRLAAGESTTLRAEISLPAEAGDELQGVGSALVLRVTTVADDAAADQGDGVASLLGRLPRTGADLAWAAALAALLVACGLTLLAARRRAADDAGGEDGADGATGAGTGRTEVDR
ncbi:hypothetical protein ACH436_15015 [Isoptericola sp. NPDC019693]|uniref:hypothetical protein n=1 Tax=Isoptericola sp. NPDC019693 TaxID=3364009 RepID=UPI0037BC6E85